MKKIILLVALIAVGCYFAGRMLKSGGESDDGTQAYSEPTDIGDAAEVESPAEDAVTSEVAG
jgi:hypothetical protein